MSSTIISKAFVYSKQLLLALFVAVFAFGPYGFHGVSLTDWSGLSFGKLTAVAAGPGNVDTGLSLWLKADTGGNNWTDQSGNNETVIGSGTITNGSLFNFNPSNNLATNGGYEINGIDMTSTDDLMLYSVYKNYSGHMVGLGSPVADDLEDPTLYPEANGVRVYSDQAGGTNDQTFNSTITTPITQPHIAGLSYTEGVTNADLAVDGSNTNGALIIQQGSTVGIGSDFPNGGGLSQGQGEIAEVIVYKDNASSAEKNQITSYLAIKYGITLDASVGDYFDSTGSSAYDLTTNTNYQSNIVGIGRDDASSLDQRVSKSVNTNAVLTLATTNDFVSANGGARTALVSGQYIMLAADTGSVTSAATTIPGYSNKIVRQWRAETTGTAEVAHFKFDIPAITGTNWELIQSDTSDFADAGANLTKVSDVTATGEGSAILADGKYYGILEKTPITPGGVSSGLDLWLKADKGVIGGTSVTRWDDQSGGAHDFTDIGAGTEPDNTLSTINFNPTVTFDGTTDILEYTGSTLLPNSINNDASSNSAIYSVVNTTTNGAVFNNQVNSDRVSPKLDGNGRYVQSTPTTFSLTGGGTLNTPVINSFARTILNVTTYENGLQQNNATMGSISSMTLSGRATIGGRDQATQDRLDGDIAEVIIYDQDTASATDRQQIESYLAIKYGITLDSGNSVYRDSAGDIILNPISNGNYLRNVFAIARDDAQGLDQRISSSVNSDTILTAALDNNFTLANNDALRTTAHTADGQHLFFTTRNGTDSTSAQSTELLPSLGYNTRLTREWKVNHTAAVATNAFTSDVYLKFDGHDAAWHLIGSPSSGDMSHASVVDLGALDANGIIFVPIASFPDDFRFTLAKFEVAPGGVSGDLSVWLKADAGLDETDGAAVDVWVDQSSANNDVSEATNQPDFRNNATDNINFNPVVEFNGTNDTLSTAATNILAAKAGVDAYVVGNLATAQDNFSRILSEEASGVGNRVFMMGHVEGPDRLRTLLDAGATGVSTVTVFEPAPTSFGVPRLFGSNFDGGATTVSLRVDGTVVGSDTNAGATVTRNSLNQSLYIGNEQSGTSGTDGSIAEVVVYGAANASGTSRQQIESYLALKYGMTLDVSVGNYRDAAGDSVYNLATYNNHIVGIARDDASSLDQRVSKSVSTGAVLTLATTNDFTSANGGSRPVLSEGQYVILGSDNAVTTAATTTIPGYTNKIARQWRAEIADTTEVVHFTFDIPAITGTEWDVVQSDTSDFADAGANLTKVSDLTAAGRGSALMEDGKYYGVMEVGALVAPGGVSGDLSVWLKADAGQPTTDGATATNWIDQSGNANDYTVVSTPTVELNELNFNPGVDIRNGEGFNAPFGASLTTDHSFFAVSKKLASDSDGRLFDSSSDEYMWAYFGDNYNSLFFEGQPDNKTTGIAINDGGNLDPHLFGYVGTNTTYDARTDGEPLQTFGTPLANPSGVRIDINQGGFSASEPSDAHVYEFITYDTNLDSNSVRQIESYLAIKYGITLDVAAGDYRDAAGGSVYNLATYNNSVIGIARDNASTLDQQISKTLDTTAALTISTDNNFTNANGTHTSLTDGQYLVVGHDGTGTSFVTSDLDTANYAHRVEREWRVENTGSVGAVNLKFANFTAPYGVLSDIDGDFTTTGDQTYLGTLSSTGEITGVTLVDGVHFTLALEAQDLTVEFASTAYTSTDEGTNITVNLSVGGADTSAATARTIEVDVTGGTATNMTDYNYTDPTMVTIPAADYTSTSTITTTISINQDLIQEGDEIILLGLTNPSAKVVVGTQSTATATITDDDIAGVTVTPGTGLTSEDGTPTDSFTVVLDTEPSANVTISVVSDNTGEGTVSDATLLFTPANWNVAQTVTVTGVDDTPATDDGTVTYNIVLDVDDTATVAAEYDALTDVQVADVVMQNQNNDAPGVVVTINSSQVDEAGPNTGSFTVTLLSQPTSDVTIPIATQGFGKISIAASSVTLNSTNWDTGVTVTVTAIDNTTINGSVTESVVTGNVSSTDPSYTSITANDIADPAFTVIENDQLTVQFSSATASDSETSGGNLPMLVTSGATFMFGMPFTVDVTVTGTASVTDDTSLAAATFTVVIPAGSHPKTIPLTGLSIVNDMIDESDETLVFTIANPRTGSGTADIRGLIGAQNTHTYTINDDDTAAFTTTLVGADNLTDESGGTAQIEVVLETQPTGDVVINTSTSDAGEGVAAPATITFTPANWNVPQTVTVTGQDDVVSDGTVSYDTSFTIAAAATADVNYDALALQVVSLQNQDDDAPGIVVTVTDVTSGEDGTTATVNFKLLAATADGSNVTIPLSISDTTEASAPTQVIIADATALTTGTDITVTGLDDTDIDGDIVYTLVTGAVAASGPSGYAGITAAQTTDASLTNTDNDVFTVAFSVASANDTESAGGNFPSIAVAGGVIAADATVDVVVTAGNAGAADYVFATPVTVTIPAGDYTTASTVAIPGFSVIDDQIDEDNELVVFGLQNASAEITVGAGNIHSYVINDDDTAALVLSAATTSVTEGESVTYSVALATEPIGPVLVQLATDNTEAAVTPTGIVFNPTNWNIPQQVTVTGTDDTVVDGSQTTVITHSTLAGDVRYQSLPSSTHTTTIADNDIATGAPIITNISDDTGASTTDAVTNDNTLVFSGTASITASTTEIFLDGTSLGTTTVDMLGNWIFDYTGTVLADATYGLTAIAYSGSGTPSATSSPLSVVVDTMIATTTAPTPTGPTSPSTSMSPNIVGSCGTGFANGTVSVTTTAVNAFTPYPATQTLNATGDYDFTGLLTWIDGTYDLHVACFDQAGNGPATTTVPMISVDNSLPSNPTIISHSNNDIVGTAETVVGACEPGAMVSLSSSDITPNPTTGTCTSSSTYSIAITISGNATSTDLDVTQTDMSGNISATTTVTNLQPDGDGDGVSNNAEDNGFNGGDGNGDGIPDRTQQSVSAAPNPVTGGYTTLQTAGACTFITENAFVAESSLAAADPTADYPVGLVDFQVTCPTAGDSANVTIFYAQEYDTSAWSYKKFDANGNAYADITGLVTFATDTVGTTTVTTASFTVTDGDPQTDEDTGPANGVINDPSGPATVVTVSGGGGGGGTRYYCRDEDATNYTTKSGKTDNGLCKYDEKVEDETVQDLLDEIAGAGGDTASVCKQHLTETIRLGGNNNSVEVNKLIEFLNDHEGEDLEKDGTYDADDFAAVKRFQAKYSSAVLDVWGLENPTGYVYLTTRMKINSFMCNKSLSCPVFKEYNNRTNENNNSAEVQRTKVFMTELGFYDGPINQSYDNGIYQSMIDFQETFSATMLKPWNLSRGTGYKYKTTNKFMNEMVGCPIGAITLENGVRVDY